MESHLLQMRGLKHIAFQFLLPFFYVASFTDAWIETKTPVITTFLSCRIFYRCVD